MGLMTSCSYLYGRGCGLYFILLGLDIYPENYLMPREGSEPYIQSLNTGVELYAGAGVVRLSGDRPLA